MSISNVRKALTSAAKDVLDTIGFSGATAWENARFDPSDLPKWAKVTFVSVQPFVTTLGAGGDDRVTGYLQVDLNVPQDSSVGDLDSWIESLRAEFVAGKGYPYGGTVTTIINAGPNAGSVFDNWYRKSVTITYRADLPRSIINP